jgi:hypothetical protein
VRDRILSRYDSSLYVVCCFTLAHRVRRLWSCRCVDVVDVVDVDVDGYRVRVYVLMFWGLDSSAQSVASRRYVKAPGSGIIAPTRP